jgi:hypothetical protein
MWKYVRTIAVCGEICCIYTNGKQTMAIYGDGTREIKDI